MTACIGEMWTTVAALMTIAALPRTNGPAQDRLCGAGPLLLSGGEPSGTLRQVLESTFELCRPVKVMPLEP